MKMKRIDLLVYAIAFACFGLAGMGRAFAQQLSARATLDTSTILIGQQVSVKLAIDLPRGTRLQWPRFQDTLARGVELVSQSDVDTLAGADPNLLQLSQRLRITSFDTGFHLIPAIPFYREGATDSLDILALTNDLFLTVKTVPVDTTLAIKDVKGVMGVPLGFWEVFRWVLLGLLLLAAALAFWWYYRWKKKKLPLPLFAPKPAIPAHLEALEALEALRTAKLWQGGLVKEYHTRLTDILRTYLEKRFGIMAMEMTTDEIMEAVDKQALSAGNSNLLEDILQMADLVKFAKEQPLPTQHDLSLKNGIAFVNLTRPAVIEPNPPHQDEPIETPGR